MADRQYTISGTSNSRANAAAYSCSNGSKTLRKSRNHRPAVSFCHTLPNTFTNKKPVMEGGSENCYRTNVPTTKIKNLHSASDYCSLGVQQKSERPLHSTNKCRILARKIVRFLPPPKTWPVPLPKPWTTLLAPEPTPVMVSPTPSPTKTMLQYQVKKVSN